MPPRSREEGDLPLPFTTYPTDETELLKTVWVGGNCRRGYGLKFIEKTHQTSCAYCNMPLTKCYDSWLTMVLDHVVPVSVCVGNSIRLDFCRSLANTVLACAACNGFANRYKPSSGQRQINTFREFLELRDEIFLERREKIQQKHKGERAFFDDKVAQLRV
jgi:hypothetical protein